MPYKSDAQRRLFHHLAAQGKIPMSKVREYDAASKGKKLPEFVGHTKKAFGGQIEGKKGVRCPACDYPLDQIPVALDAGEACPRCGYGDAKDVPHKAQGGEIMDPTAYRARGGTTFVPVYTRSGARSEQSVRSDENPTRFAPWRDYEKRFVKAKESPLWRLREELATRGVRSGERDDLVAGYVTDDGETMGEYVMPRRARGGEMYCSKCGHEHKMARGGDVTHCARCGYAMGAYIPLKAHGGDVGLEGDMKELYPRKKERGADLDDGKIRRFGKMFADAIKYRRR